MSQSQTLTKADLTNILSNVIDAHKPTPDYFLAKMQTTTTNPKTTQKPTTHTVKELQTYLTSNNIKFPTRATKAQLEKLVADHKKPQESTKDSFKPYFKGLTEIQKGVFTQYLDHLDEEAQVSFSKKLQNMEEKERIKYLKLFFDDVELMELEDSIFHDSTQDSKRSRHEDLYGAREDKDPSGRLLLYQAMVKKLVDKDTRTYMYGKCFRLDLDTLRHTRKESEAKFRETVYEGFIAYLKRMKKTEYEKMVDSVFDKSTKAKDLFKC